MSIEFVEVKESEVSGIADMAPRDAFEKIITLALEKAASDLFLHANQNHYQVSLRQYGTIQPLVSLPLEFGIHLTQFIKSSAEMDLVERRRPLDGRFSLDVNERQVDFRVNSIGSLYGEDIVMRVLPEREQEEAEQPFEDLGFVHDQLSNFRSMLNSGGGLVLVTGPTGAGKTTTLYSGLQFLNNGKRMITTLEDPVERVLKGRAADPGTTEAGTWFSGVIARRTTAKSGCYHDWRNQRPGDGQDRGSSGQ